MSTREINIAPDITALSRMGADEVVRCAKESIAARGGFTIALSGGSTPQGAHALLAEYKDLPWNKVHIFFGDDRHVPPDDKDSNYRAARESLLSKINIPPENVHRIKTELDAQEAAQQYEQELNTFFQLPAGEWPRLDLIMLGMGPDGHTASLFPGTAALNENSRWVVANRVEKLKTWRITFTFPLINHATEILYLVNGDDKAQVLKDVLENPDKNLYPTQRVQPVNGKMLWVIEKGAARLLNDLK
ncbi:MAG: 6-phosphogluconolactonase [Candidatus Angelobacter sp. Gp1-AA117]|nr:MAG: 6-phosphogluconolactonase [Candidatus Angelobacter sp. Gp1-AA117]